VSLDVCAEPTTTGTVGTNRLLFPKTISKHTKYQSSYSSLSKNSPPFLKKTFSFVFKQNQFRAMSNSDFEKTHETLFRLYSENKHSVHNVNFRLNPR
jgi:hypothetical protein